MQTQPAAELPLLAWARQIVSSPSPAYTTTPILPPLEQILSWAPPDLPRTVLASLTAITDPNVAKQVALTRILQWAATHNLGDPLAEPHVDIPMVRFANTLLGTPTASSPIFPPRPAHAEPSSPSATTVSLIAVQGSNQIVKLQSSSSSAAASSSSSAATSSSISISAPHPVVGVCAGQAVGEFLAFAPITSSTSSGGPITMTYSTFPSGQQHSVSSPPLLILPEHAAIVNIQRSYPAAAAAAAGASTTPWTFLGTDCIPFVCSVWKAEASSTILVVTGRSWLVEVAGGEQEIRPGFSQRLGQVRIGSVSLSFPYPDSVPAVSVTTATPSRCCDASPQLIGDMVLVEVKGCVHLATDTSLLSPPIELGSVTKWSCPCTLLTLERGHRAAIAMLDADHNLSGTTIDRQREGEPEEWSYDEPITIHNVPHSHSYALVFDTPAPKRVESEVVVKEGAERQAYSHDSPYSDLAELFAAKQ